MKHFIGFLLGLIFLICCQKASEKQVATKPEQEYESPANCIADTIIYDVIIRNTNPYDTWMEKSLGKLQHSKLIDSLFSLVYERKIKAYDYFSNEELSPKQVKAMENEAGFTRDRIGKIQFTEAWYFNKGLKKWDKEVISIALGYELYRDSGELRGYKPVFKLYLNP